MAEEKRLKVECVCTCNSIKVSGPKDYTLTFQEVVKNGKITLRVVDADDFRSNRWAYRFTSFGKQFAYMYMYINFYLYIYTFMFYFM